MILQILQVSPIKENKKHEIISKIMGKINTNKIFEAANVSQRRNTRMNILKNYGKGG